MQLVLLRHQLLTLSNDAGGPEGEEFGLQQRGGPGPHRVRHDPGVRRQIPRSRALPLAHRGDASQVTPSSYLLLPGSLLPAPSSLAPSSLLLAPCPWPILLLAPNRHLQDPDGAQERPGAPVPDALRHGQGRA